MRDGSFPHLLSLPSRALKGDHMSYNVKMDGVLVIDACIDMDILADTVNKTIYGDAVEAIEETDDQITLAVGSYGEYKEEVVCSLLKEIEPFTLSGEIDCFGEDNSIWRHYYDRSKHNWIKQTGSIKYDTGGTIIDFIIARNKAAKSKERFINGHSDI